MGRDLKKELDIKNYPKNLLKVLLTNHEYNLITRDENTLNKSINGIKNLLSALSRRQGWIYIAWRVIILRYKYGYRIKDISDVIGCTESEVYNYIKFIKYIMTEKSYKSLYNNDIREDSNDIIYAKIGSRKCPSSKDISILEVFYKCDFTELNHYIMPLYRVGIYTLYDLLCYYDENFDKLKSIRGVWDKGVEFITDRFKKSIYDIYLSFDFHIVFQGDVNNKFTRYVVFGDEYEKFIKIFKNNFSLEDIRESANFIIAESEDIRNKILMNKLIILNEHRFEPTTTIRVYEYNETEG